MGQRLIITVEKDSKEIATLYFHWSAYTLSSIEETAALIGFLDAHKKMDTRLACIRFVEENGGCIDGGKGSSEFKAIQKMFPNETFKDDGNRNNGLVALTENGMSKMRSWSEGDVTINLDDRTVLNWVNWTTRDSSEYDKSKISSTKYDISDFSFDEIDDVYEVVDIASRLGLTLEHNGVYYKLIE